MMGAVQGEQEPVYCREPNAAHDEAAEMWQQHSPVSSPILLLPLHSHCASPIKTTWPGPTRASLLAYHCVPVMNIPGALP